MKPPKPDCYDYVRRYYGVPAYVGVRVQVRGRGGVLVEAKHSQHYVHIWLDGDRRSDVYHPTDGVKYFIERRDSETPAVQSTTSDVRGTAVGGR